jgi:CHASE2 domain-containing sensor protein
MYRLIALNLGQGDLQQGFPTVTAQVWDDRTSMQFTGSLPPVPTLDTLYQRWQLLYKSFYANFRHHRHSDFEIDDEDEDVGNISHAEFQQLCKDVQVHFNRWLCESSFLSIERKLRTYLTPGDEVCLIIVAPASILTLPWCLWDFLSDYPLAEIALSPPEYARPFKVDKPAGTKKKVKILSILGDSTGINIAQDQKILKEKLPEAEITFLTEPSSQELNEHLWQKEWDILFFAGHSSSQGKGSTGCIQINSHETLTVEQLKYGLKKAISNGLKLAIFNSCDGLGLAVNLADLYLPQVIVMREPVPDQVAQEFLKHFLTAFKQGKSLYIAVREAREKLQALETQFPCATWLPVVCQNPAEIPFTWSQLCGQKDKIQLLPSRRALQGIFASSLVTTLLILGIRFFGLLSSVDLFAFDLLMRSRTGEAPDDRILVVTVTAEDIQAQPIEPRFGSLSDTTLYKLLTYLNKYQPLLIGLDIYRDYPSLKPELAPLLKSSNLIGVCKRPDIKDDPAGTLPSPEIPATKLGFSDFVSDNDGAIRRHLLFMHQNATSTSKCAAPYAFNTRLAVEYLFTKHQIQTEFTPDGNLKLGKTIFPSISKHTGGYQNIDALGSQILLNYRAITDPRNVVKTVTLKDIFSGQVNPEAIKNRIVLIGIADPTRGDYWSTPYGASYASKLPGVLIHAQMLSQILSTVLDNRPLIWVWSTWQEIIWTVCWSSLGGFIAWRFRNILIMGIVATSTIIILITTCWIILNFSGWVPLIAPLFSFIITNGAVTFIILMAGAKF